MPKAGIVIDSWKVGIFTKILDDENYSYRKLDKCPTPDTITLQVDVEINNLDDLKQVVERGNTEASKRKRN